MIEHAQHMHRGHKPSKVRTANATFAILLIVFLFVHACLGAAFWYGLTGAELAFAAWIGVGLCAIHLILSIATTVGMLTDKNQPPSHKKKMHQVLKWVTGLLALGALALHLTVGDLVGNLYYTKGALIALLLLCLLGFHAYIGIKSLTRDLYLSPELCKPFRIGVIFFSAFTATVFFLVSL